MDRLVWGKRNRSPGVHRCGGAWLRVACGLGMLPLAIGACAVQPPPPVAAQLPAQWRSRTLYATPAAIIYAVTPAAATELEALVRDAAAAWRQACDCPPATAVLIARDVDDPPLADDRLFFGLSLISERRLSGEAPPGEAEIDAAWQALHGDGAAPRPPFAARLNTIACDAGTLHDLLGFPAPAGGAVRGALLVPTRRYLEQEGQRLIAAVLDREKIGAVLRVVLAPFIAAERASLVEALRDLSGLVLFAHWAEQHADWSPEQRAERVARRRAAVLRTFRFKSFAELEADLARQAGNAARGAARPAP